MPYASYIDIADSQAWLLVVRLGKAMRRADSAHTASWHSIWGRNPFTCTRKRSFNEAVSQWCRNMVLYIALASGLYAQGKQ